MSRTVGAVLIRPLRAADVATVERLSSDAFHALDVATRPADWPPPARREEAQAAAWRRRCHHLLRHDAPGCWVAEDASGIVGMATSLRRETWWGLSSYFVCPRAQGTGIGRAVLDAALQHSQGALRGTICSSHDPRAVRRYRQAGFTLYPVMFAWGTVDRSLLPVVDHVRSGSAGDFDLCDSVDRLTRGAGHGVDHPVMAAEHPMLVIDNGTGSGYCYVAEAGGPYLLAASNLRTATRLLWESLAASTPGRPVMVRYLTAEQEWAVDVALEARLELHTRGYLAYRGMKPATPYVPSPHVM